MNIVVSSNKGSSCGRKIINVRKYELSEGFQFHLDYSLEIIKQMWVFVWWK